MDALPLETVVTGVMTAAVRVGGLMVFAPFLGSESVSMPVKAGFTFALTGLLYPVCRFPELPLDAAGWMRVMGSELMVGVLLGVTLNFILDAVQFAGQLIGLQMGFSLVNVMDPQTQVDTPVLSIFHQLVVLLIFLQMNVHHWLLRGLAASFSYLPPGGAGLNLAVTGGLLHAAGGIWLVGLQMAAPVVVATMLADIALGFLGKASPQLPILFFALSIKSVLGLILLLGTLTLWPRVLERHFADAVMMGERLLHLAR
jgi:flagellar biosynthetic protein FliR